ncbi:MAG: alkaline phosphatase family protein [Solirubrobacterales bacterium]
MIGRPADHSSRHARGELADLEVAERLEAADPESFLRRREFLGRTAALAGLAGLATTLPTETLIAEAAKRQVRRRLPRPRDLPIDSFVVLMMENRSFDHYFGWHRRADGRNAGLAYPDAAGVEHPTYRLTPDFQGCGHPDPDHGWGGGRHQYNGGRMDGFFTGNEEGTGSDEFAIGYYLKQDLGFIPHAAKAFTLYDRWFCSLMASTYPNRHYQLGAQNGGQKGNDLPLLDQPNLGFEWETICDRALSRGLSVGYYVSDLPFPALYGLRGLTWVRPVAQFYLDAALGRLPNVCFVDPPFRDGGGGNGLSADEHPHGDIRLGQAFMSDVVNAFVESPQYRRGALFINYDEWGGFFDHVRPRFVRDDRANPADLDEDWGFTGFRVPAVAISPYTRAGRRSRVSHMACTHESILKLISYRFGLGRLTTRHRFAANVGRSFNFNRRDFEPPDLPDPAAVATLPCALGGGAGRPKEHDLAKLETSGLLDRLGYDVQQPTFESLFRYPDRVRRAFEASRRGR